MEAKKRTTLFVTTWLCVGMILMGGCAHPLVIKNLDSYRAYGVSSFEKPLKIGIATDATEPEQKRLMDGIANALGGYSAQVVMPYQANSQKEVDFIAHVDIQTEYKGSGWNFLINWPGFLIWTPAWHGYNYRALYGFDADITNTRTNESLPRIS